MAERIRIVIEGDGNDAEHAIRAVRRELNRLGDENKRTRRESDQTQDSVKRLNSDLRRGAAAFVAYRAAVQGVKFSSVIAGAGLAAQAINGLAASAVAAASALAPLAGLGGAAAAGLTAYVQAAGTATAATYGVSDAVKAYITDQESAATTAVKTAKTQESAAETARNASNRLADAHRQEKYAQEQLTQARKDAHRELEDMADSAGDARLAKRRATLSLQQARNELSRLRADPDASYVDVASASLGVQEAKRAVADANREAKRSEEDYQQARKRGVDRMPDVVAAQRALADAQRSVAEAAHDASRAAEKVGDAAGAAAGGVSKFDQAMANLPPSAREFVRTLVALEPQIAAIRKASADGLFPGLTDGVRDASRQLPVLRRIAEQTALSMGRNARRAGGIMGTEAFSKDLELVGERNARVIDRTARSGINLAQAFRHIVVEAGPLLNWLSLATLRFTELIEQETRAGRESGDMARFFRETRDVTERLGSILQSTAAGLYQVGRAAKPLGDDILEAIDDAAQRWEEWTESIEGQREMRQWFDDAKPAIWEMGRLLDDVVEAWLRLGANEGTADLIRQLRVELLPVLEDILQNTTAAFGPELIDAVVAAARLLGELSESGGPLVTFLDVLGRIADALSWILDTFPQIKTAVAALAVGAGVYKALQLAAAVSGLKTVVALLRAAKVEGAGLAVIGGLNVFGPGGKGGKGGKGPGVGGAGGVLGGAAAGSVGGPWGALAGAAIGAGLVFGPGVVDTLNDGPGDKARKKFEDATKGAKSYQAAVRKVNDEIQQLKDKEADVADWRRRRGLAADGEGIRKLQAEIRALRGLREAMKFGQVVDEMRGNFAEAAAATRRPLAAIRDQVEINAEMIKTRLGRDSAAGRRAMVSNFNMAAQGVRDAMNRGLISTERGLAEIRRLMVRKLQEFGFSEEQAKNIRKGQRYDGGANEGGAPIVGTERAGGGWIGRPGEAGRDKVPAMLGRGEAVLNRHQQRVVNAALAATGQGNLNTLFSRVKTPHYLASGGFAGEPQHFAGGGVVEAGRRLRAMGYAVGEHPAFGGVAPVHTQNSYHYRGLAIDVNADNFPGGEGPALDKAAAWLRREYAGKILELLWRTAGHHDHLHAAIGGSGTGGTGGIGGLGEPPEIKRVLTKAKGRLGDISQAALDTFRAAAQKRVEDAFAESASGMSEPVFEGGMEAVGDNQRLGRSLMARFFGSEQWPALKELWTRESGWNNMARNPSSGAFGIPQARPPGKMGAAAVAGDARAQILWGLRYIKDRYGSPSAALRFHDAHNWYAQGGFVDDVLFAASGAKGNAKRNLAKGPPVPVGPRRGRAQKTTGKQTIWKPSALRFTGKLRSALPQIDQLFNLDAVINAMQSSYGQTADAFDLTDENATRTLPVAQVSDEQLRSLGLSDDQIGRLRAAEGQEIEVLNQGTFSDGRGITEHVAELTALIERKKQIGGHMNTKRMVAEGLVQAIQAAVEERKQRLREIADRIAEVRRRIQANTREIRSTQNDLNGEEKKKRPDKKRIRRLRNRLSDLRDEREHLTGHRTLEGSDDPTPQSMLGVALKYRDSTREGLRAYEEELPNAQSTLAGVPGDLYDGVTQPINQMAKEIGDWLGTAAPKITVPDAQNDGRQDEINRLKAQLLDEEQRKRRLAETQFGVFEGFAPLAAGRLMGSFARGIARVPHDGVAMLHRDEMVIPSADGPFRMTHREMTGGGGSPVNVELRLEGDAAHLVRLVDARVDGRVARVSQDMGKRARLMTIAPGRG